MENETSHISSEINILNPANKGDECGTSSNTTSSIKADNVSKLLLQDFDFVEESLEEVKRKAFEVIAEVRKARHKFQKLILLPEGAGEKDSQLQELKKKVSKLKSGIPFKLIAPPQKHNPNVNWRPRPRPDQLKEISLLDLITRKTEQSLLRLDPRQESELQSVTKGLETFHLHCLLPFLEFPPNAFIKRSLLFCWVSVSSYMAMDDYFDFIIKFNQAMDCLIEKGLIEAVKKKASLTMAGYRMNQSIQYALTHCIWPIPYPKVLDNMCLGTKIDKKEEDNDVFYTGSSGQFPPDNYFDILHLGKWKKSSPQHIEFIDNPDFFFKDFSHLRELEYISLRGISMIEELPKIFTDMVRLEILDLKACYNLEVIPPALPI